jgi:hypothetical protein
VATDIQKEHILTLKKNIGSLVLQFCWWFYAIFLGMALACSDGIS